LQGQIEHWIKPAEETGVKEDLGISCRKIDTIRLFLKSIPFSFTSTDSYYRIDVCSGGKSTFIENSLKTLRNFRKLFRYIWLLTNLILRTT
jgi:hypothetical protein